MKKYDNFGCSLNFYSEYEPKHGTGKTTIIYLLEGTAWIALADSKFKMQKDDLILINYGQGFMWHQEGDVLICVIEIDKEMLRNDLLLSDISFKCNSVTDKDGNYKEIKHLISDLIVEYTEVSDGAAFKKKSLFFSLLDVLLKRYISDGR